jgi:hypothetical protein
VEGRGRHDEIEGPAVGEVLKRTHLESGHRVRHVAPGRLNHRRADVDGRQAEAPAGQLPGELACATANLKYDGPWASRGSGDNKVNDLVGITLAAGVIQISNAVEKTPLPLPRPALLFSLGGHDHSLPRTSATSEPADSSSMTSECTTGSSARPVSHWR